MSKNTVHKYWFWCSYENGSRRERFYFAVPMKDRDALLLIGRVHSALKACFINAYLVGFSARKAYSDTRKGIPIREFDYALSLWREILPFYYTKDALDIIFSGF